MDARLLGVFAAVPPVSIVRPAHRAAVRAIWISVAACGRLIAYF